MASEIRLEGFDAFKKKLAELPKKTERFGEAVTYAAAKRWEQLAKDSAPIDQGTIVKGIVAQRAGLMTSEVTSNAASSRFMEWGTKSRKLVPADMVSYESTLPYRKAGDYFDFLNAILDWVKRKGLARITNSYTGRSSTRKNDLIMVAQAVANSISRHGIKPKPFFFKHKAEVEKSMKEKIEKYLNTEQ